MAIKVHVLIEDKITGGGYAPTEIDAEMLHEKIAGKSHIIHRNLSAAFNWAVSEYASGTRVGWGYSINAAILMAENNIKNVGEEKYSAMLNDVIKKYGRANMAEAPTPSGKTYESIASELLKLNPIEEEEECDEE